MDNTFPVCKNCFYYDVPLAEEPCADCQIHFASDRSKPHFKSKSKPTNGDAIRAMSDEELAEWVAERSTAPNCTGKCHKDYEVYGELRTFCHDCWLDWLKQRVDT